MIKTVTLNPALDKTIILNEFEVGRVNRVKSIYKDAGGKGINVSKLINNLGGKSIATGILAGQTGAFIRTELDHLKIEHNFIEANGETRTNIKLVDLSADNFTDINESGIFLSQDKLAELEQTIFQNLVKDDILVLAGSVPRGVSKQIYAKWIKMAKENEIKTVLDADGPLFQNGIKAGPTLIKPNNHELAMFFDRDLTKKEDIVSHASKLFEFEVEMIMTSLGADGAIFLTEEKKIMIEPLSLDVKSTVGAGDAMVGALSLGVAQGLGLEEMITLAAAASSATLLNEGTKMASLEQVMALKDQIRYYYL